MAELNISVISPEKILYEGEAKAVTLPGSNGNFMVLTGHAPLVSMLEAGLVSITTEKGEKTFVVDGGFCEIENNVVSALVEGSASIEDIDVEAEKVGLNKLLAQTTKSDEEYKKVKTQIQVHRAKLRAKSSGPSTSSGT